MKQDNLKPLEGAAGYYLSEDGTAYRQEVKLVPLTPDAKGRVWVRLDDGRRSARSLAKWYADAFGGEHLSPGAPRALTDAQVEQARQLREEGKSLRDVADVLGVSHTTIRKYLEGAHVSA